MTEDGWPRWHTTINLQEEGSSKRRTVWLGTLEDRKRIKLSDAWGPETYACN